MATSALADRPTAASPPSLEDRIVDGLLECIGRWGIAKTTVEDVARAAGVSRATVYRAFPGGKDVVFEAVVRRESSRFLAAITSRLDAAETLEDAAVIGMVEAARFLTGHEGLRYLLANEPERVLPAFAFHRMDGVLAVVTAATAPHLRRFVVDDAAAVAGAEWIVRLVLSYSIEPRPGLDLTDEVDVRPFVCTYVLPAVTAPHEEP
ncbi:MAG TPA: TetR/AcrR family transcriptional regulator [Acidimicrobiales bacterium]|nr:TetR/AcrR family transcriptional regulator [Acidimicrobiales bacterium]